MTHKLQTSKLKIVLIFIVFTLMEIFVISHVFQVEPTEGENEACVLTATTKPITREIWIQTKARG